MREIPRISTGCSGWDSGFLNLIQPQSRGVPPSRVRVRGSIRVEIDKNETAAWHSYSPQYLP